MNGKTLAILIALVLSLALAACSGSDDGDESGAAGGGDIAVDEGAAEQEPALDRSGAGGGDSGEPVSNAAPLPGSGPRIIQTAALRLVFDRGRFDSAAEEARGIAGSLGGFVVSSSESRDPGAKVTTGTMVLRVPQASYSDAMSRLGRIGKVSGREESGQDVSAEFVDLESRKRHLEAVETQLLTLLERADNVAGALAVQAKLNDVQLQLEQVRGRLRFLDDQTAFATISLALREQAPIAGSAGDEGGILDAWADGARAFANAAAATFVAVATIAPVLLLLALVALGVRVVVRRGGWTRRRASEGA